MGNISEATIAMDFTEIADGQRCGLACMGKINNVLGIKMEKGQKYLYTSNDTTEISTTFPNGNQIYLRVSIDMTNQKFQYFYSTDNIRFIHMELPFLFHSVLERRPHCTILLQQRTGSRNSFIPMVQIQT